LTQQTLTGNVTVTKTIVPELSDGRKPKRAARIPFICKDAVACGVSRQHLQAVLTGNRIGSTRLMSLYAALKADQAKRTGAAKRPRANRKP
jgi:hypothetical protein